MTSLIPEDALLTMAESTITAEVKPYQFEPMTVVCYSDEESDSDESDTDVREQASFTERLGKVDWCSCSKCVPLPRGIECQCCREMDSVYERLVEQDDICCITNHDQFSVVCLNKDVLYTALVMINRERCEPVRLPLSNRYVCCKGNRECNPRVLLSTENTDWLHIDNLFTGHIVGWVEGYVGLSLLVL